MNVQKFYAHSKPGMPKEEWQELREHLQKIFHNLNSSKKAKPSRAL